MRLQLGIIVLSIGLFTFQSCKNEQSKSLETISNKSKPDTAPNEVSNVEFTESPGTQFFSEIRQQKIALQAEAIILNSVTQGSTEKAYLIFNVDQSKVEVFLPKNPKGILYERKGTEGNHTWTDGLNELILWKGYVLRTLKQATPLFAGDLKYQ